MTVRRATGAASCVDSEFVMMPNTSTSRMRCLKLVAVPLLLASLAACAAPFNAKVSRFQSQLPAPQGQSFAIVADDPALSGGLEFAQYARLVEGRMAALGYTPVNNPGTANLIVHFDYGVDKGRERIQSTGFGRDPFC